MHYITIAFRWPRKAGGVAAGWWWLIMRAPEVRNWYLKYLTEKRLTTGDAYK
jgi:hypothetical protein